MSEEKKGREEELEHSETAEQPGETDKIDELLADMPEWLRGPLKENYRQILASIAIVILAVSLWSGYSFYTTRLEESASYHLGIALSKQDVNARIKELEDLRSRFSHTSAARLSRLLLGQARLEKGEWKKAEETFKACTAEFEGALSDTAIMGQGYASEAEKDLDQALADYKRAETAKNGFESVALLDSARLLAEKGKKKEALQAYDRYLDLKPQSPFLDFIRYEILKLS